MTEEERRTMLFGDNARREVKNEAADYPVEVTESELPSEPKAEVKQPEQPTPVINNSPAPKKGGRLARFLDNIKK